MQKLIIWRLTWKNLQNWQLQMKIGKAYYLLRNKYIVDPSSPAGHYAELFKFRIVGSEIKINLPKPPRAPNLNAEELQLISTCLNRLKVMK